MWWYLYELLYPWLINCLHRADTVLSEHLESQAGQDKRSGKGNKKKGAKANKKGGKAARPYLTEIASYQAHASMCAGYYKLMVAARMEGKILVPAPLFDKEAVRCSSLTGFSVLYCCE